MAAQSHTNLIRQTLRPQTALWLASVGVLATLLAFLTRAIMDNPLPAQDVRVMEWIAGWDLPGLDRLSAVVEFVTGAKAGFIYIPLGLGFLLLMGKSRAALVFGAVALTIGTVAILGDYTLGQLVDRGRPLATPQNLTPAFPSGHVFGSMVFFGFIGFLAVYYRLNKKLLVPVLGLLGVLMVLVGPGRIYEQAHFPSDVAAGYLLAGIWLLIIIPVFVWVRGTKWMSSWQNKQDLAVVGCDSCQVARSIASVVVLDPVKGTATKVYKPPPVVRLLYWIAFQAKFPYESNAAALQSGKYRRQIASLLTRHRFGKDLVSPVTSIDCSHGTCSFVTEFVPGKLAENDEPARKFLGQVSGTFAEAGLSVWQVNPRNPHAHTNLIQTPEGDYKIIDLESAVVTLLPAPGQFRSSLKSGKLPIFDDIDFPRLKAYIRDNESTLDTTIGRNGLAALKHATEHAEVAINAWKDAEPRIWGHIISRVYKLFDWKSYFQHLMGALVGADQAAELFLNSGIDRWEKQHRISPDESAALRARLASSDAQIATRHLGVHLVLSVAIAIPVPGARSAARFLWTMAFWAKSNIWRLRGPSAPPADNGSAIHTPLVMALALIPGLGGVAYLASRPLRSRLLIRLVLDQLAWKLPFRLYQRAHIGSWLAPAVKQPAAKGLIPVPAHAPAP